MTLSDFVQTPAFPGSPSAASSVVKIVAPSNETSNKEPVVRIDYLFLSPDLAAAGAIVLGGAPDPDGFYPSDHRGLAMTVRDTRSERQT